MISAAILESQKNGGTSRRRRKGFGDMPACTVALMTVRSTTELSVGAALQIDSRYLRKLTGN